MENQYYVEPANFLPGLNAAFSGMRAGAEAQMNRKGEEEFVDLVISGDVDAIRKASMLNPELAAEVQGGDASRREIIKARRADMAMEGLMGGKTLTRAAIDYTDKAQRDGAPTEEGLALVEATMKDEEKAKKLFEVALAMNGTNDQWENYKEATGQGGVDTGPSTDISRYAGLIEQQWELDNPGDKMPPGLKAEAMMKIKRANPEEVNAVTVSKLLAELSIKPSIKGAEKSAELRVIEQMQPGIERDKAIATHQASAEVARGQSIINEGLTAAEAMPNLKRGIDLLEKVQTGGLNSVALNAKRFFGVEGADEGELSNRLAKAVLSQLRETFGSAFTADEGAKLDRIEAGFSKSPENNKRLLSQALLMSERKVSAARTYAENNGDTATLQELKNWEEFRLSPEDDLPEGVTEADITTTMQKRNMTRQQVLDKLRGK